MSGPLVRINTVPGFISAYCFGADGTGRSLKEREVDATTATHEEWLWLHITLADRRCLRWLQEKLSISPAALPKFAAATVRQKIEPATGLLIGHLAAFRRELESNSTEYACLYFALGHDFLVTARVHAVQSADHLRTLIAGGARFTSPEELLTKLISIYPDSLDAALHRLTDELEIVEDHILDERHRGERRRLMIVRREVAHLHRHMRGLRRALNHAERQIADILAGLTQNAQRLSQLEMEFEALESRARLFHDEIDAKLTTETNRQLYILSALTAAFLPPTLIAGLFGMNVGGIPWSGSPFGFWAAIVVGTVSASAVILYLHITSRA